MLYLFHHTSLQLLPVNNNWNHTVCRFLRLVGLLILKTKNESNRENGEQSTIKKYMQ